MMLSRDLLPTLTGLHRPGDPVASIRQALAAFGPGWDLGSRPVVGPRNRLEPIPDDAGATVLKPSTSICIDAGTILLLSASL